MVLFFSTAYAFVVTVEAFVFGYASASGFGGALLLLVSLYGSLTATSVLATYGLWRLEPRGWHAAVVTFAAPALAHAASGEYATLLACIGIALYVFSRRELFRNE